MNNHLSDDQLSRYVLGQATAEEEQHGRTCPRCSGQLMRFSNAVSTFQGVMHDWSKSEPVPQLEKTSNPLLWPRWAVAGLAVAVLASLPILEQPELRSIPEPTANSDELLMREVAAHLSRPLPKPMERVMVLLPDVEQGNAPESEEAQ